MDAFFVHFLLFVTWMRPNKEVILHNHYPAIIVTGDQFLRATQCVSLSLGSEHDQMCGAI